MARRLGMLFSSSRDPTWRAQLAELIQYIDKNAEGIKNASNLEFYSSGPIEKAFVVTICKRFKKRGLSWYVHRATLF